MNPNAIPAIFIRWIHIFTAALLIGGAFFLRVAVPYGLSVVRSEEGQAALLRMRRIFKMVVHGGIVLMILSGAYNTWANLASYKLAVPLSHALLGTHILLALIAFTIALVLLAGARPPKAHRRWMAINLIILALVVAAASSLKWVREHAPKPPVTAGARP